jgi:hypothetical protein
LTKTLVLAHGGADRLSVSLITVPFRLGGGGRSGANVLPKPLVVRFGFGHGLPELLIHKEGYYDY